MKRLLKTGRMDVDNSVFIKWFGSLLYGLLVGSMIMGGILLTQSAYAVTNPATSATPLADDLNFNKFGALNLREVMAVRNAAAFASIQAAIDNLPTSGGMVFIPAGSSSVSATINVTKSNVQLIGAGNSSIIAATGGGFNMFYVTGNNFRISNLQLQGAATDETTQHEAIVTAPGSTGAIISDVFFTGTTPTTGFNSAIHIDEHGGISRHVITRNRIQQLIGVTAYHGYGVLLGNSNENIITYNHFLGSSTSGRHAIYVGAGSSHNIISDNIVNGFAESQISVYTQSAQTQLPPCQFNIIDGNILTNMNTSHPDWFVGAVEVAENSHFNSVVNNTIVNTNTTGVAITGSGTPGEPNADDNRITGNLIYKSKQYGIRLTGGSRNLIGYNMLYENSQSSVGTYPGIEIASKVTDAGSDSNRIIGNYGYGTAFQRSAIRISSATPIPTNTQLVGNFTPLNNIGTIENQGTDTRFEANPDEDFSTHVKGVSTTSTRAYNLRGSVTISGTATSTAVTFPTAEPDTNYYIVLGARRNSGTPAVGAYRARYNNVATTGFTIYVESAPGSNRSVTVNWMLVR